jgi:hypothetical protein
MEHGSNAEFIDRIASAIDPARLQELRARASAWDSGRVVSAGLFRSAHSGELAPATDPGMAGKESRHAQQIEQTERFTA